MSSTQLTADITAQAGTYSVTVTNPAPGGGTSNSQNLTVTSPSADLQVSMSASPNPVTEYQNVTYTVTIHNNGPQTATNVSTAVHLSSSSRFVSASSGCSGPGTVSGGTVNCGLSPDSLINGATATLNVVVQFTRVGTFNDANASVQSTTADPISGNNTVGSTITVQAANPPGNDNFANATTLNGNSGCISGLNIGATVESSDPDIAGRGYGKTVWYKWLAPDNGFVEVQTAGSNFDTVLGVYPAYGSTYLTAGSATNDDYLSSTSRVFMPVAKQQLYYIVVSGYKQDAGQINLCWAFTLRGVPPSAPPQTINNVSPFPFIFIQNPPASSPTLTLTGQNLVTNSKVFLNGQECTTCQVSSPVSDGTSLQVNGVPVSYFSTIGAFVIFLQSRVDNNTSNAFLEVVIGIIQVTVAPNSTSTVSTPATQDDKPTTQTTATLTNPGSGSGSLSAGQVPNDALTQPPNATLTPPGTGGGQLIGQDGAGLIGQDGAGAISLNGSSLQLNQSAVVSNDGGSAISKNASSLLSHDGSSILSEHGVGKMNPGSNLGAYSGGDFPSATSNRGWYIVRTSGGQPATVNVTHDSDGTAHVSTSVTLDQTSTPQLSALQSPQLFAMVSNPVLVQFSATSLSVNETGPSAQLTVTRTGANLSQPGSVDYATSDGTAQAGLNYTATSGTLKFAAGETSKTISVPVIDDHLVTALLTFNVTLTNPVNTVLDRPTATATVTINENDTCAFVLGAASTSVSATGGTGSISFTGNGTSCGWTATSNAAWISITSGTSGTGNGSVNYTVTANTGAARTGTLTIGGQTYTINQAGAGQTVQFNSATYTAGEGDGKVNVTITRSGDASGAATVRYATSDGTGKEGKDYTAAYGVISFAPGETSKTFIVLIIDNGYVAGTRTVNLTLSNPTGATLSAQSTAVLSITENDTSTTNPADQARFFVQQHYYDFLGRYPDQGGWDFWINEISSCGTNQSCIDLKRINVSAAYFLSIEFQQTGYLVERIYKTAYGSGSGTSTFGGTHQFAVPVVRFSEFLPDTQQIGSGVVVGATGWETVLENNKQAFTGEFVQRSRFTTAFPTTMTPAQFVDKLNTNAGNILSASERGNAIALFGSATDTSNTNARAQAVRQVAENATLNTQEFNRAFVLMQFLGYLRRDPNSGQDTDYTGYDFWLTKLNQFNGNFVAAEMVKAFITSTEYRQRFGP